MTKSTGLGPEGNTALIFEPNFNLIAIVSNSYQAAKLTGSYQPAVHMAIKGGLKTTNSLYFRSVPPNMEVYISDLYSLKLQEFDQMCGLERSYETPERLLNRAKKYNKETTIKKNDKRKNLK